MKSPDILRHPNVLFDDIESSKYILLPVILLFALIIRLSFFSGITGGDDLAYLEEIHKTYTGNFEPASSHWGLRLGFILPSLLCVYLFGFNEAALALFPLVCSVAHILLIYAAARLLVNEKTALLSAFLMAFFPLDVFFATMIFLDTPLALFMGLSAFYFIKGDIEDKTAYYVLSGLFLGLAYLIKETGLYITLFFIGSIIIEKKIRLKYGVVILSFLFIFFLEFSYYYLRTGNPVYRLSVAEGGHHTMMETLEKKHNNIPKKGFFKEDVSEVLVLRGNNWYIEPFFMLATNQEFGFFYYFILPIMTYFLVKKDKKIKIVMIWMIPMFIYILYGTTNPFSFSPLRRWPRYLTPVTAPALIILAYFLIEKRKWLWHKFTELSVAFLLITSLMCIFLLDTGTTDSFIVKKIAEFRNQNSQKDMLVYWGAYQHLAPFLEYRKDIQIKLYGFPRNKQRPENSLYYGLELEEPDEAKDSYIVIPCSDPMNIQKNHSEWKLIHSIDSPKKFYCPWTENASFFPTAVREKLCPDEVCRIYYIP